MDCSVAARFAHDFTVFVVEFVLCPKCVLFCPKERKKNSTTNIIEATRTQNDKRKLKIRRKINDQRIGKICIACHRAYHIFIAVENVQIQ